MEAHLMIQKIPEILGRFFDDENQYRVDDIAKNVMESAALVIEILNDLFKLGLPASRAPKTENYAKMYSHVLKELDKMEGQ